VDVRHVAVELGPHVEAEGQVHSHHLAVRPGDEAGAVAGPATQVDPQLSAAELNDNEEFVLDVATYALNHLRPIYSYTLLGKLYTENLDESYHEEVEKAVSAAILKIRGNP
jgi:hypothetical protein